MPTVTLDSTVSGYAQGSGQAVGINNDLLNGAFVFKDSSSFYSFAVKWDLTNIPAGATISSAYVQLYITTNSTVATHALFNVYEATSAWEGGTSGLVNGTYLNSFDPSGLGTGGTYNVVQDTPAFRALVSGWVNGGTNHGVTGPSNNDTLNGSVTFMGGPGRGSFPPHLVVTYTTLMPPNVPTGLGTLFVQATSATASWAAPAVDGTHNAATSYTLQRAKDAAFTNSLSTTSGIGATSTAMTGLLPGTTYWIRVSATNADGTSAYSAGVSFTTLASQTLTMVGAPSAQVVNPVTIKAKKTIIPTGALTAQVVNAVVIKPKNMTAQPGIPSAEAFNAITIVRGAVTVTPTGVLSAEAFGLPLFNRVFRITLLGAPSAEAFNPITIVRVAVTTTLVGVPSAQAVNPVAVQAKITTIPTGVPSAQVVSAVALINRITLALLGALSAQAVNPVIVLPGSRTVTLVGAPSLEAFGNPTYNVRQTTVLVGVPTGEIVNPVALLKRITLLLAGVPSGEAVSPMGTFLFGSVRIYPASIASSEAFGTIFVVKIVTYVDEGVESGQLRIAPSGLIIITNAPFLGGLLVEDQPRLVLLSQPLPEGGLVVLNPYDPIDSGVEV